MDITGVVHTHRGILMTLSKHASLQFGLTDPLHPVDSCGELA